MIESKIYALISDFVDTNHKTKFYSYILPSYLRKIMTSLTYY